MDNPHIVTFLGVFLTFLGLICTTYGTIKSRDTNVTRQEGLKSQNESLKQDISGLEIKLKDAEERLKGQFTGGDEYANIILRLNDEKTLQVFGYMDPDAEYGMFDVKFRIYKTTLTNEQAKKQYKKAVLPYNQAYSVIGVDYGEIPVGSGYDLGKIASFDGTEQFYRGLIFARNGNYSFNIHVVQKDGKFLGETIIFERGNKNKIFKIEPFQQEINKAL